MGPPVHMIIRSRRRTSSWKVRPRPPSTASRLCSTQGTSPGRGLDAHTHSGTLAADRSAGCRRRPPAPAPLLVSFCSRLGLPAGGTRMTSLLVVSGTQGIGLEIARRYVGEGWSVVLSGRDESEAKSVAEELGGDTRGIALDLSEPEHVAGALAEVTAIDHVVLSAISRDRNTIADYDI